MNPDFNAHAAIKELITFCYGYCGSTISEYVGTKFLCIKKICFLQVPDIPFLCKLIPLRKLMLSHVFPEKLGLIINFA